MIYSEKLKDPRWQKIRLKILERDGWKCRLCDDEKKTLHVHHKRYLPRKEPWEYPDKLLATLCEECHEVERSFADDACDDLVMILRGYFLSPSIRMITQAFVWIEEMKNKEDIACALCWALNEEKVVGKLVSEYKEALKKQEERQMQGEIIKP